MRRNSRFSYQTWLQNAPYPRFFLTVFSLQPIYLSSYTSKDGETTKSFPALEWLAAVCSHIPNRGEQMVRYYGYYSNVSRGKRRQEGLDDAIPCILEPQGNEKAFRKNLAWLLEKIYEVDPLVCPRCNGTMRIISSMVRQAHHARLPLILSLSKDGW